MLVSQAWHVSIQLLQHSINTSKSNNLLPGFQLKVIHKTSA